MKRFSWPVSADGQMKHFGTKTQAFSLNVYEKAFIREHWDDEYLIIDSREKREKRMGWCTHCRKWEKLNRLENLAHLSETTCPQCGRKLQVIHTWRKKGYMSSAGVFYLYRPSKINPAAVTCRMVWIDRSWDMGGELGFHEIMLVDSFYVFEPGKKAWQLRPDGCGQIINAYGWTLKLREDMYAESKKARIRDWAYWQHVQGYQSKTISSAADIDGAFKAAEGSPLRHGMKEWLPWSLQDHFIIFWDYAARFPAVEWLLKMGLGDALKTQLEYESGNIGNRGKPGHRAAFNLKGRNVKEVFQGVSPTKADKRYALSRITEASQIRFWQCAKGEIPLEETRKYEKYWYDFHELGEISEYVSVLRFIRYAEKQKRIVPGRYGDTIRTATIRDYRDYLYNAKLLNFDMKDRHTLFPSDFWKAHDDTAKMAVQIKDKLAAKKFKKRYLEMKKRYEFEDKTLGMKIVVPKKTSDLVKEGKMNHNCVGTYVKRVASGKTDVVFVRFLNHPETSYITMEIQDGKIKQARTFANGPLDKDGEAFVELFRKEILEKKQSKRRKTA